MKTPSRARTLFVVVGGSWETAGLGPGTSPLTHGNLVILQCDQEMGDGSLPRSSRRSRG